MTVKALLNFTGPDEDATVFIHATLRGIPREGDTLIIIRDGQPAHWIVGSVDRVLNLSSDGRSGNNLTERPVVVSVHRPDYRSPLVREPDPDIPTLMRNYGRVTL